MRRIGTVDEWLEVDPLILLINKSLKCMDEFTCITQLIKLPKPVVVEYSTLTSAGDPFHTSGYLEYNTQTVKREISYEVYAISVFGTSGPFVLSLEQAQDPNWEELRSLNDLIKVM